MFLVEHFSDSFAQDLFQEWFSDDGPVFSLKDLPDMIMGLRALTNIVECQLTVSDYRRENIVEVMGDTPAAKVPMASIFWAR